MGPCCCLRREGGLSEVAVWAKDQILGFSGVGASSDLRLGGRSVSSGLDLSRFGSGSSVERLDLLP